MTNPLGLYIHVPFCAGKCRYCGFYSVTPDAALKSRTVDQICAEVRRWGGRIARPIDTVYLGGGTPSLLTAGETDRVFSAIRQSFSLLPDCEITCEVNPGDDLSAFLDAAVQSGVNRISVGVQSANDDELALLGRRHRFADAIRTVDQVRKSGIDNLSVDIMLGLPGSDLASLGFTIEQILSLKPNHISAYILKLEEGTPLWDQRQSLHLPDDDQTAKQYLFLSERLADSGFEHYEISNFAKTGFQSRHNNKYWLCEEYLGIGPAAHSFLEGKRFYYPNDLGSFLAGNPPVPDGTGGDEEEYVMLRLRLKRGLNFAEFADTFGHPLSPDFLAKAEFFAKHGLCIKNEKKIALTEQGMLVSNTVIVELIEELL